MAITGTFTDNGSTETFSDSYSPKMVAARGDFGGGTLQLEVLPTEDTDWISAGSTARLSAEGIFYFVNKSSMSYRLTLSGATSPNLEWHIL